MSDSAHDDRAIEHIVLASLQVTAEKLCGMTLPKGVPLGA